MSRDLDALDACTASPAASDKWVFQTSDVSAPQRMLFVARSLPFASSNQEADGDVPSLARARGRPIHLPWFVVTFLAVAEASAKWETACAVREEDLFDHLRKAGDIQIAELLYMAPPTGNGKWTRHRVGRIEQGVTAQGVFSIYIDSAGHEFCFSNPELDLEMVKKRKVLLRVDWWRAFN
jgi:hypothetical protein